MKIKHFEGVGLVEAKKIRSTNKELVIEVWKAKRFLCFCGMAISDPYVVHRWLVSKFDNRHMAKDIISVDIENLYKPNPLTYNGYDEGCIYTIRFR